MSSPSVMRRKLSLIIPTYKRPSLLAAALASVAASQGCGRDDVEVIVVDNSSAAEARDVVARATTFPFDLYYLLETRPGVSSARNTGAAAAAGDYFVFMDDDQQIDQAYLARVVDSFKETGADCVGGWLGYVGVAAFPPWLRGLVIRMGQRDLGPVIHPIACADAKLAGGNMAVRKDVFERVGGFRADLIKSQDIELQNRILQNGGRIFYDPALRQNHYLEPARMTRHYYLQRAFLVGRAEYRINRLQWKTAAHILGAPRFLWRQAAEDIIRAATALIDSPAERFDHWCEAAGRIGQLREAFADRIVAGSLLPS